MDLSFKEKSAWISFISILAIFGYYFFQLCQLADLPVEESRKSALWLLGKIVVLSIIVETLFHTLVAVTNKSATDLAGDERDRSFEQKANQIGYYVLSFGVVLVIGRMLILEGFPQFSEQSSLQIPMLTMHMLMLSFVLSELTRFGAQILFYRRGY